MKEITCISQSIYPAALTRGKRYKLVKFADNKRVVRIRGDNNRTHWYPAICFDFENQPVPMLQLFSIDDPHLFGNSKNGYTEVTIKFSTGELRWCNFATPSYIAYHHDGWIPGSSITFSYNNQHLIITNEITYYLVEQILKRLDSQNELIKCTLPLDGIDDTDT